MKSNYLSRYQYGVVSVRHKDKDITTSVGTEMDDFIENINQTFSYTLGKVPMSHDKRPDLTSFTFYDSPKYWWMIMQYNNFTDPFEDLAKGTTLKIPKIS